MVLYGPRSGYYRKEMDGGGGETKKEGEGFWFYEYNRKARGGGRKTKEEGVLSRRWALGERWVWDLHV